MSRSRWRPPTRIAEAVSATVRRLGLETRLRQGEIWRVWPQVVGAQIARHAQPHALWHGRLVVHVTDPVWLHHLSMMRHRLVAALTEQLGGSVVRELILRIGEVAAPPVDPKPPAGPEAEPPSDPAQLARIEALLAPLGDAPCREDLFRLLLRAYRPTAEEPPQ
jgi:predicted nucleic acid-binding Zn ribbon protein